MATITKMWIATNMRQIMLQKPIDKIRVTEICQQAHIKRPTFYYHFKDKYDLLAFMFCDNVFETNIISIDSCTQGMNKMKKEFSFYKRIYEDTSQNPLWQYILKYFVERYTNEAKRILQKDTLDAQTMYSIRLYCYGAVYMTREWLLYDKTTSAETIITMMFKSMPELLRNIFFR